MRESSVREIERKCEAERDVRICVVVCCSALQSVRGMCVHVLQCSAVCCGVLQGVR